MSSTASKWAARVSAWRASGRTAEDYAQGRGFAGSTLRWWSSRLRRGREPTVRPEQVRMVKVVPVPAVVSSPAPHALSVTVGPAHIEVRPGFDAELLRQVVDALGGQR